KAKQVRKIRVLLTMFVITLTHLFSVFIYSLVYYSMDNHFGMGTLAGLGLNTLNFYDYIYYSLIVYTSLGFGDIYPVGGLRILSGLETLNGLILIAWSASYTYLVMSKYWRFEEHHASITAKQTKETNK
ncbi:MAG TPA: two pore domain potassium channel family protein, partial [Alphaproteobacteria bacterium]|nr:two pore domain potassium channel family protein [Alphaproteobacteria bacterium]